MSWIKLTRKSFTEGAENEELTINTDSVAYYTKWQKDTGSVVVTAANNQIIVTETVSEIDAKIGVNLASLQPANVFDPCI